MHSFTVVYEPFSEADGILEVKRSLNKYRKVVMNPEFTRTKLDINSNQN